MKAKRFKVIRFIVLLSLLLSAAGLGAGSPRAAPGPQREPDVPGAMPAPINTFDGLDRATVDPAQNPDTDRPDVSGDAGRTVYIQAVNTSLAIFPKSGPTWTVDATFDEFWAGAGTNTACDGFANQGLPTHHGQPNVAYDHMAKRWVVVDVAYTDVDDGPYYFCLAVSKDLFPARDPDELNTNDWWYYAVETTDAGPTGPFYYPDQPRLGVWPDGYFLTTDLYDVWNDGLSRTPKGAKVWAFNRSDLMNHWLPFHSKAFWMDEHTGFNGLIPANVKGETSPITGKPNYITAVREPNELLIWKFKVDWQHLGDSNYTYMDFNPVVAYVPTGFTKQVGYLVPQPNTSENLDLIGDRLNSVMFRVVEDTGALWATHSVIGPNGPELRWYELRNLHTNSPTVYQAGIFTGGGLYRWNSGVGVDADGNMAVGYSLSGPSTMPTIKYAGRMAGDPVNQLSQGERDFLPLGLGTTYQNFLDDNDGPWGAKSAMTVDPVDTCVFWYTNQYYDDAQVGAGIEQEHTLWRTRIGWFRFPSCGQGKTARVSLHTDDTQGNQVSGIPYEGYSVSASHTGRWVAFASEADNLVDGDTNDLRDIFVRDRDTDQDGVYDEPKFVKTVRVSLRTDASGQPHEVYNGHSWEVSISADGRFVAFSSDASDLVQAPDVDNNGVRDVFLHDRDVDGNGVFDEPGGIETRRISLTTLGDEGGEASDQPAIAVDKTTILGEDFYHIIVAYRSAAALDPVDTNGKTDIYAFAGNPWWTSTQLISTDWTGVVGNDDSFQPAIATDLMKVSGILGTYIAFASRANNLDLSVADTNGLSDVYLSSLYFSGAQLISRNSAGTDSGNGESYQPTVSGNRRYVAYISRATDIDPADANGPVADVILHDTMFGTNEIVSVNFTGLQANGDAYTPSISDDGRSLAFASDANNLDGSVDTNGRRDIFFHNHDTGLTHKVTRSWDGAAANDMSAAPAISGDGRHVAFPSRASNLVVNDSNHVWDVFAIDRRAIIPTFLTVANKNGYPGKEVVVPIVFERNGYSIDTTTFSVDYDQTCLTFNDGAGAVTFFNSPGEVGSYSFNPADADGELDFTVMFNASGATIFDGKLAEIKFTVQPSCQALPGTSKQVRVGFSNDPIAYFAKHGESVRGRTADGMVSVLDGMLGDCDPNGKIDAGDISALIKEIFDGDGSAPANTPKGTFPGDPVGCNPNWDVAVDAGDISCDLLMAFGWPCSGTDSVDNLVAGLLMSGPFGSAAKPELMLPVDLAAAPGAGVSLPVVLNTNGHSVNAVLFALNFDPAGLAFDPKDGNGDGLPDAVHLSLPAGFTASVNYDAARATGEMQVAVLPLAGAPAQTALSGGKLMTIDFTASASASTVTFSRNPGVSFGSTDGASLPGEGLAKFKKFFLPSLWK